jgi:hypothetical protein
VTEGIDDERLRPLLAVVPGAKAFTDGPDVFIYLPSLRLQVGDKNYTVDALLAPNGVGGYASRLYLSQRIAEREQIAGQPANWTDRTVAGRVWYVWSWQGVPPSLPLLDMLGAHMVALK